MTLSLLLLLSSCRTIENINYNSIQIVEDDCCCDDDNNCCDEDENNCAVDNGGTTTTSTGTTITTPIDTGETSVHTGETGGHTGRHTGGDPCAEYVPPTLPKVVVDETCLASPASIDLDPVVEWAWPDPKSEERYNQVMMTPVVSPLVDTNKDGVVDENDIPVVVFTAMPVGGGTAYLEPGALVAVSGLDGSELFHLTEVEDLLGNTYKFPGAAGVALGDLEGDGSPDICVAGGFDYSSADPDDLAFYGSQTPLICLEGDGTFKWAAENIPTNDPPFFVLGAPSIGDMDGDGQAEVTIGNLIVNSDGTTRGLGAWGTGDPNSANNVAAFSAMADVYDDASFPDGLELLVNKAIYNSDGSVPTGWSAVTSDGAVAVGDFDLNGFAEIVAVYNANIYIVDSQTGTYTSFSADPAKSGGIAGGGTPTVADFDGDGLPEIGIAFNVKYAVFEVDGTEVWSHVINDTSSQRTGSSVFDFEGDGVADVVFADQDNLYIFNGQTGVNRLDSVGKGFVDGTEHHSDTLFEYPTLADIDGDGSTEIILASRHTTAAEWTGVRSIGSASQSWVGSRPVWNQHTYHITNINDDGSIPTVPTKNWTVWNNFRTADAGDQPNAWLANLEATGIDYCDACASGYIELWIPVTNDGLVAGGPFDIHLYDVSTLVYSETIANVSSGEATLVGPIILDSTQWTGELTLIVDAGYVVDECDEVDNVLKLGEWPCP